VRVTNGAANVVSNRNVRFCSTTIVNDRCKFYAAFSNSMNLCVCFDKIKTMLGDMTIESSRCGLWIVKSVFIVVGTNLANATPLIQQTFFRLVPTTMNTDLTIHNPHLELSIVISPSIVLILSKHTHRFIEFENAA
jgi:hypothetical protein